jgi:hypothetical protein
VAAKYFITKELCPNISRQRSYAENGARKNKCPAIGWAYFGFFLASIFIIADWVELNSNGKFRIVNWLDGSGA